MTMVVTVLIGIGIVLITSSIDCTPILDTLQKITSNQAIDWTGQSCQPLGSGNTSSTTSSGAEYPAASPINQPATAPRLSSGRCPPGYHWDNNAKQCLRDYRGVL